MDDRINLLDLNTADLNQLKNLPGVGAALATRIYEARPYQCMEDLLQVRGFGSALLNTLQIYATVIPPNTEFSSFFDPIQTEVDGLEALESDLQIEMEQHQAQPESVDPDPPSLVMHQPVAAAISRQIGMRHVLGAAAVSGLLSFLLASAFILLFLALVNGGLRFVRPAELSQLSRQVSNLGYETSSMRNDIDGLEARLDQVDGLIGRVEALEENTNEQAEKLTTLDNDLDELSTSIESTLVTVNDLGQVIDDISVRMDALFTRTQRFQNFLEGMRNLLDMMNEELLP